MTDDADQKLKDIERALYSYHYALDLKQETDTAARRTIDEIQAILGRPWAPAAVLGQRRRRFTWSPDDLVIIKDGGEGQ